MMIIITIRGIIIIISSSILTMLYNCIYISNFFIGRAYVIGFNFITLARKHFHLAIILQKLQLT